MTDLVANALEAVKAFKAGVLGLSLRLCLSDTMFYCLLHRLHGHGMCTSISVGNLSDIGVCLSKYREQKLIMAPGNSV